MRVRNDTPSAQWAEMGKRLRTQRFLYRFNCAECTLRCVCRCWGARSGICKADSRTARVCLPQGMCCSSWTYLVAILPSSATATHTRSAPPANSALRQCRGNSIKPRGCILWHRAPPAVVHKEVGHVRGRSRLHAFGVKKNENIINAIAKQCVIQHKICICSRTRFGVHFSDKNVRRGLGLGELELARKAAYFGALVPAGPQLLRRRAPSVLDLESEAQTQKRTKKRF